jgi:hypothetical protein
MRNETLRSLKETEHAVTAIQPVAKDQVEDAIEEGQKPDERDSQIEHGEEIGPTGRPWRIDRLAANGTLPGHAGYP